jgi:hypothetical protein
MGFVPARGLTNKSGWVIIIYPQRSNIMQKFLILLALLFLVIVLLTASAGLTIAVLTFGWGLKVVSWWWVIGGALGHWAIYTLVSSVSAIVKEL